METVTNVAPSRRDPGLIVWYCPHCNAADSELVYTAATGRRDLRLRQS